MVVWNPATGAGQCLWREALGSEMLTEARLVRRRVEELFGPEVTDLFGIEMGSNSSTDP